MITTEGKALETQALHWRTYKAHPPARLPPHHNPFSAQLSKSTAAALESFPTCFCSAPDVNCRAQLFQSTSLLNTTMLARRVCANVRSVNAVSSTAANTRVFSVIAAARSPARAPALADITPNGATKFIERQKQHREGVIAAQQKKEQEESECHRFGDLWRTPNHVA
jgi:hypothetical protein